MTDYILASLLMLGGACWSFVVFMAGAMHPSGKIETPFFISGIAAFLAGVAWWAWLIMGWL